MRVAAALVWLLRAVASFFWRIWHDAGLLPAFLVCHDKRTMEGVIEHALKLGETILDRLDGVGILDGSFSLD